MLPNLLLVILVALTMAGPTYAEPAPSSQTADSSMESESLRDRTSIVFLFGGVYGDPRQGLEDQLRDAGFNDTDPISCFFFCSGGNEHPRTSRESLVVGLAGRFAMTSSLSIGLGYSAADLSGSTGYRDGLNSGNYVESYWRAKITWASVFFTPHRRARFGVGPGLYRLKGDGVRNEAESKFWRVGLIAETGLELPLFLGTMFDFSLQYHFVGSKKIEHGDADASLMLKPSWKFFAASMGIGWRF